MSVAIIGTIALDNIRTPKGSFDRVLGGSATYAGLAAALFSDQVHLISIVGQDFPSEHMELFATRGIQTLGIERSNGQTFHWEGYYEGTMNQAFTLKTDLNVLLEFDPKIPAPAQSVDVVFLANLDPVLQQKAIGQFSHPKLIILDSMNFWIETQLEELKRTISMVDLVILNDQEIRLLTGIDNLIEAMPKVTEMGPSRVIVKKGEHGSVMFNGQQYFICPAYPLVNLVDPTGAGDSFAGAISGYLSQFTEFHEDHFRKAMVAGTLTSSYTVRGMSISSLKELTHENLNTHFAEFKQLVALPDSL